ncbi:MAG: DinB family protein [Deinococcota bacterium]
MTQLHQLKPHEYNAAVMYYMAQAEQGASLATMLSDSWLNLLKLMQTLDDTALGYRYAPSKWTIADVFQHVMDEEKMMSFRASQFAQQKTDELWRYSEFFTPQSQTKHKSKVALIQEFAQVRQQIINLFGSFSPEQQMLMGSLSGNPASVRAIGWVIAGHEQHHVRVINTRYLGK